MLKPKSIFVFAIMAITMAFANVGIGQQLELSKIYEISGKAKRGYLGDVEIKQVPKEISLTFVTKSTDRKAKFEAYVFDHDFNYLRTDMEEVEFEKARLRFKWFKFKGEQYQSRGLYVEPNLMGTLVLRRKLITYKWDWFNGGYYRTVKIEEKLKPKTDDGRKLFYHRHAEYETGNVCVLSGEKAKIKAGEDPYSHQKNFYFQSYDLNIDKLGESTLTFEHPQHIVYANVWPSDVDTEDGDEAVESDFFVVFAPAGMAKKVRDEDPGNWTYVRVNSKSKIIEKVPFKVPSGGWDLDNFVVDGNDIYFLGAAENTKSPYRDQFNPGGKYDEYQVACISGGKVKYVGVNKLDDFATKKVLPPSQKKGDDYRGKKYRTTYADVFPNGHLSVTGQTIKEKDGALSAWDDILMFQFDQQGKLVANYSVNKKENNALCNSMSTTQNYVLGKSAGIAYWLKLEIAGARNEGNWVGPAKFKALIYPSVGRLDYANQKLTNFVEFGKNEKGKQAYYLHNKFPYLPIPGQEDKLIFFGESKNGRTLWFGRMPLD